MPDFNYDEYIKSKVDAEPRLIWLSDHDHVEPGARVYVIADKANMQRSAALSTKGLDDESDAKKREMLDVRFKNLIDALFGVKK